MSSGKKKADLIAIFKLEFYRKQNRWKFCSQVQKAKKSATDKATCTTKNVEDKQVEKCLNKTYNIEKKDGEDSVLNEAFLETVDGKTSPSSPEDPPQTPPKEYSLKIIRITDKWSPPPCASLDKTINMYPKQDSTEKVNFSQSDLNLTATVDSAFQIWAPVDSEKQYWPEHQNSGQYWPYLNQNNVDFQHQTVKDSEEIKLDYRWLHPEKGLENIYQNCENVTKEQNNIENLRNDSKLMRDWTNINMNQNIGMQRTNNNNFKPEIVKIPEPVYANWCEWKARVADMDKGLEQNCQSNIWSLEGGREEWPEMDRIGQEGFEPECPWGQDRLISEDIWSDEVLRELELLNVNESEKAPSEKKWVPPDRLLHWMLANKECCESLLEDTLESIDTFIYNAHSAPHSSEVNLQPQLSGDGHQLCIEAMGAWSHAARRCRDARARDRHATSGELRSRSAHPSPRRDVSCEEYPTRDVGLHQPLFTDTFITGSHKNDPNNNLLERKNDLVEQADCKTSEGPVYIENGRIVVRGDIGQFNVGRGQIERNSGQSERTSQVSPRWGQAERKYCQVGAKCETLPSRRQMESNKSQALPSWNQIQPNKGHILPDWRLTEPNKGQAPPYWGQIEPNKGQALPIWGQIQPKRCQTAKLRVQGNQIVIDRCENSANESQFDIEPKTSEQWGGFGNDVCIGRGRGRLGQNDSNVNAGRGRGRL